MEKTIKTVWRINTPQLLNEITKNNTTSILEKPILIFAKILKLVADRASEINDDKMNALMCMLSLYTVSDPYHPDYDRELTEITIEKR